MSRSFVAETETSDAMFKVGFFLNGAAEDIVYEDKFIEAFEFACELPKHWSLEGHEMSGASGIIATFVVDELPTKFECEKVQFELNALPKRIFICTACKSITRSTQALTFDGEKYCSNQCIQDWNF